MQVVRATNEDLNEWLRLASEVEYLFGPMVEEPSFIKSIENNINRRTALCVRENNGSPGANLLGGAFVFLINYAKLPNQLVIYHYRGEGEWRRNCSIIS